jgi:glycerophosphoryl diester phosphodiesterase
MAMDALAAGTYPPWVIAHRGASADYPENTHAAFAAALGLPIAGIELDVQLSRDGMPVVFHHRTLARAGRRGRRVHQLDLTELRRLDAGGWLARRFHGEPLPALDEVLERYGGRTLLLLEVKARRTVDTPERHLELARRVVDAVRARRLDDAAYLLSFNSAVLAEVHRVAPHLRCVRNLDEPIPLRGRGAPRPGALAALCVDVRRLTRAFVDQAHRHDLPVLSYTCNTPRTVNRALGAGIDALITDRPAWLANYLSRREPRP